jgi:Methyltransferase domain
VDLLFIDGDHSYEGYLSDILNWYHRLIVNGHMIFHDSYLGSYGVQDAIIDFMQSHPEIETITSPFIGAAHWHYPAGSMAHFIKRANIGIG